VIADARGHRRRPRLAIEQWIHPKLKYMLWSATIAA
jgi:hypothetical protein